MDLVSFRQPEEAPIIATIYTLADAQKLTGASRALVTFLVNEKRIPTKFVGAARVLDESGLTALRKAVAEYREKREAAAATA